MPRDTVFLDTNVLVGALSADDSLHDRSKAALAGAPAPLVTCWPVLVEAAFLLRRRPDCVRLLWVFAADERAVRLLELGQSEIPSIASWMVKYGTMSPDFADAAVVHLAEREGIQSILTFDADFHLYRTASGRRLNVVPGDD